MTSELRNASAYLPLLDSNDSSRRNRNTFAPPRCVTCDKLGRHHWEKARHVEQSRRSFLRQLSGLCSAFPLLAVGQQRQRNPLRRIGFLIGDAPILIEAFKSEMRALGYIEGQNLFIDVRTASGPEIARHAAALAKADLEFVVAGALPFALEIRKADPALPMVIATCPGMISNGFAKTLERPGGNVTGMEELPTPLTERISSKRLPFATPVIRTPCDSDVSSILSWSFRPSLRHS